MRHISAARPAALRIVIVVVGVVCSAARSAAGQAPAAASASRALAWNDARTLGLVRHAVERRAQQLADTALRDYQAQAHGYLTFLAQLGDSLGEPPKVVRADELALEVYWRAPNLSKQRIVGRRDTLALPTDINYHRDHLAIIQNNFPDIIRLGEGDEVADVPHPLSVQGLAAYDYAIRDSLSIRLPDRLIDVYEVRVRPKDDRRARIIGAVYIDRATGEVVRMAFNFTRAAFLDKQLEDVFIVLENALVAGRFWLPRRQEVEIVRGFTWLDFPVRGIIRGRWDVRDYRVNVGLNPAFFLGDEIVMAPPSVVRRYPFTGRILDSLPPDVRVVRDADVQRVQEEARELVRAQALERATGATLSARRVSDFARVNRVEGLALGAGGALRLGAGVSLGLTGRWGFSDREPKGRAQLALRRASGAGVRLFAERSYRDAGDVPETSPLRNSIAAQEFGSDYTDPFDVRAAGVAADVGRHAGLHWTIEGAYEAHRRLGVHAVPAAGRFEATIPALPIDAERLSLGIDRPTALAVFGTELRLAGELRALRYSGRDTALGGARYLGRAFATMDVERPLGRQRLVLRSYMGGVTGRGAMPPQELVYLGGPTTGPGYDFHAFAARFGAAQHVEVRTPIRFVTIPLGRFGRAPAEATLAPFAHDEYATDLVPPRPGRAAPGAGWYPSVGVGTLFFFNLVRVDVARGLRDGRWTLGMDLERALWGIL